MLHPTATLLSPPHTAAAGTIAPGPRCPIRAGSGTAAAAPRHAARHQAGLGRARGELPAGALPGAPAPRWAQPPPPQDPGCPRTRPRPRRGKEGGGLSPPHRLCHPRTPRVCTAEELQKRARPLSKLVITHEKKKKPLARPYGAQTGGSWDRAESEGLSLVGPPAPGTGWHPWLAPCRGGGEQSAAADTKAGTW